MGIEFKPLAKEESTALLEALRRNASDGTPLHMDPLTTGWTPGADEIETDELIRAIKSVPCHYASDQAVAKAVELLRGNEKYIADAREGAPLGNSVIGSLMSLQHGIARQYAEQAVMEALRILDSEPSQDGDTITLKRTGKAPLRFTGELIKESDGGSRDANRWHELAVYRTAKGKYVVRIAYRTRWQGELDRDTAEIVAKPNEVAAALEEYDPCSPVGGYPAGEAYADRQARLMNDIRRRYDAQVSELLASSPEFAEVVE